MKIDIGKRVREEVLIFAREGFAATIGRDVTPECEDEWASDYAIFIVDLVEPDDDVRAYFDSSLFFSDLYAGIVKLFGRKARYVRGAFGMKENSHPGDIVVRAWPKPGGWSTEIEIERIRSKKDRAQS